MKIRIEPYPINPNILYVTVNIDSFQLGAMDCWLIVREYDKKDKLIQSNRVYVPTEVYTEWTRDDDFIVDFALDQLGFERAMIRRVEFF